jgi:hypothetical protein
MVVSPAVEFHYGAFWLYFTGGFLSGFVYPVNYTFQKRDGFDAHTDAVRIS